MKIPGFDSGIGKLGKAKGIKADPKDVKKKNKESGSVSSNSEASTVSVSAKAKDIQKASEISKVSPDVRAEKIEEITKRIASGNYNVDSKDIAEKMLKDVFADI